MSALHIKPNNLLPEKAAIRDLVPNNSVVFRPETSQEHALERLRGFSQSQSYLEPPQAERLRDKSLSKGLPTPPQWSAQQEPNRVLAFFVGVLYSFAFACISPFTGRGILPWVRMVLLVCGSAFFAFVAVKHLGHPAWFSGFLTVLLVFLGGFLYNTLKLGRVAFLLFAKKMIENGKKYME